ncbi:hypothetical protein [Leptospira santarosai]|uniref:hypothetical protein n=1 Tax=Leptospira santarosai TaxID=28183 RepID=UPI0002BE8C70|nr:hypothetical protein [Leptospira santarosai]EMO69788.1 hypothetical protein LEP1GSC130_3715 [Leptospira santarosai str. 200403458]EMO97801.1 hypothetical protein LEP1GSC120_3131 [Leptospira santarosai str. 200702252]
MANETTNQETKKRGNGEKKEKVTREKPAPYIINSESEKETALLEIQEMLGKINNDLETKSWQEELDAINTRAVELKALITDRKKFASSEKKGLEEQIELMKSGIANYEVNKVLGKSA